MFFSIWAKLISISLFLLELVSFEFLSFSVSSVSTARETTRSVHFPIIIIRRSLLLADRNCYGPIFGFQSSLSGSGYFCLLWAHLRPFQQRAGALQSPCFHITGSQSCWLKKDPFSNNCVEGRKMRTPSPFRQKKFRLVCDRAPKNNIGRSFKVQNSSNFLIKCVPHMVWYASE